jgi:hypothetical protein
MPRVARFWDASSRFGQPPLGKQPGMCSENSGLRRNQRTGPSVAVKPGGHGFEPRLGSLLRSERVDVVHRTTERSRNPSVPMKFVKPLFEAHDHSFAAAQQGVPFPSSATHKLMVRGAVFPKMELRRPSCTRVASLLLPYCWEGLSSAAIRRVIPRRRASLGKLRCRSTRNLSLSRATRLTQPRRRPICHPCHPEKSRSAIPISCQEPVSAASLEKQTPHTLP